jgi:hypothetical protein
MAIAHAKMQKPRTGKDWQNATLGHIPGEPDM